MNRLSLAVVVLFLVGFIVLPVQADDRLKITGFIDNHIRATGNLSNNDRNLTRLDLNGDGKPDDDDDSLTARTRGRFFFNVEAFDNTEAVMTWASNWIKPGGTGQIVTRLVLTLGRITTTLS